MTDIVFPRNFRKTLLFLVLLIAGVALLFLFLWYARELLLVLFAGLLLALILRSFADFIERITKLGPNASYAVVIAAVVLALALVGWALAPGIIRQLTQLSVVVPKSIAQIETSLSHSLWGRYLVRFVRLAIQQSRASVNTASIISGASEGVGIIFGVLVVGFYGAFNPTLYLNGLLRLVPSDRRERARQVGIEVIETLRWWLLGQLIPMAILGVATMVGLWILRVPLAFTLGLFTGLMIFVPYIGSLLSGIPSVLVAFERGPVIMVWVIVYYIGTHVAEGYFLTPLVQRKAVRLPPILTLASQFLMWIFAGFFGVALATPLAAAGLTLVKELYLHEETAHWDSIKN